MDPLPSRARSSLLVAAALALVTFFFASSAEAFPWMIRKDYSGCATCHADPSGGELLTLYGRAQGRLQLPMRYGKRPAPARAAAPAPSAPASSSKVDGFDDFDDFGSDASKPAAPPPAPEPEAPPVDVEDPPTGFFFGLVDLPDFLLLSGSYRHLTILKPTDEKKFRTFPMQADVYAQVRVKQFRAAASVGFARVPAGSQHARAAQITRGQDDGPNVISRSHWLAYDFEGGESTVRAGRMNLPFGIRIPEHTMWVRDQSFTDRESDQHHGVAISHSGTSVRGELMAVLGNYQVNPDQYRERGYAGFVELLVSPKTAFGVSSKITGSAADLQTLEQTTTLRQAHGPFARLASLEPLVFLVEADLLHASRRALGYVAFAQVDLEAVQGLHFALTGEGLDTGAPRGSNASAPGVGEPKFGGWFTIDWFFLPHLEMRLDAIVRQEDPFQLLAQLHAYL